MPVRKIPKNYSSLTGKNSTEKSSEMVAFESKLEREYYYLFDHDRTVWSIEEQPVKIESYYEGDKISYTPDVYLQRSYGLPDILAEVKYYDDLKENFKELKPKFQSAIEYCKGLEKKTVFLILTERCPQIANRDYMFNIHFLREYRDLKFADYETMRSLFRNGMSIGDLLCAYSSNRYEQMRFVGAVWAMVKRGILVVDLQKKIGERTPIEFARDYDEELYRLNRFGMVEGGYLA